jgi:hypothetical protein
MKLFIDVNLPQFPLHSHRTISRFAQRLEGVEGWKVLLLGREDLSTIKSQVVGPDVRLLVVCESRMARLLYHEIKQCKGKRLWFLSDVLDPRWWKGVELFDCAFGSAIMTEPPYISLIKSKWDNPKTAIDLRFLHHCLPYEADYVEKDRRGNRIVFPSRVFDSHYPFRMQWRRFIDERKHLVVDYLDKSSNKCGKEYVEHIGSYPACLVVVTVHGYLILKLYEVILAGSLLLISFPPNNQGKVARKVWNSMGFENMVHYVEVTLENIVKVSKSIEEGKFKDIPKAAHAHAMAHHSLDCRLKEFFSITKEYLI